MKGPLLLAKTACVENEEIAYANRVSFQEADIPGKQ